MDAVVLAVIEHDHLAASLVIHATAFQDCTRHGIGNIVAHETVTVVTQVERLENGVGLARFKQRVFQAAILIFFVHGNRNRLLVGHTAPSAHQGDARIDFPCRTGRLASVSKIHHMHRIFNIFHQSCRARFRVGTTAFLLGNVMLREEFRINADSHHRHIYRLVDEEALRNDLTAKGTALVGCTAERHAFRNGNLLIEFRRRARRFGAVLRTTYLYAFGHRRRIQVDFVAIETARNRAHVDFRHEIVIGLRFRVAFFGSRLVEILPDATIHNTPANARLQFRVIHRITNRIVRVNQVNRSTLIVQLPVGMRTVMGVVLLPILPLERRILGTGRYSVVFLVAENNPEGLRLDDLVAKDPFAGFIGIFNKGITLQVRILGTGIVNFNPGAIIAIFVGPVQINRHDFGNDQCGVTDPVQRCIKSHVNRFGHEKRFALFRNVHHGINLLTAGIIPDNRITMPIYNRIGSDDKRIFINRIDRRRSIFSRTGDQEGKSQAHPGQQGTFDFRYLTHNNYSHNKGFQQGPLAGPTQPSILKFSRLCEKSTFFKVIFYLPLTTLTFLSNIGLSKWFCSSVGRAVD